jgi:hypothetical protein
MERQSSAALESDRALVEAMKLVGEPVAVIDEFLMCLDLSDDDHEELRRVARAGEPEAAAPAMASGDVIDMNPLTSQPQRSAPR